MMNKVKHFFKKYFKKKLIIKKGKFGIKYLIVPNSALDYHILKNGIYEEWITHNLNDLIPKNGVIFDVGANVGLLSLVFAKNHVPNGFVYAFEPDPENFIQFEKNIKINNLNNIKIFPIAIQNNNQTIQTKFNIRRAIDGDGNENRGLSSLISFPIHKISEEIVLASTIDNEFFKNQIKRIDFLKIDVEGSEYNVLLGGKESIKKLQPIIQYEYSNILDKMINANNAKNCFYFLEKLEYKQFAIINEQHLRELKKDNSEMQDVNIICFPKNKINLLTKKLFYYE
ncbi:MAG: FkbM family methyltransferase [bacterium]|nr:FkbM family methyltransferase [bacterium]